MSGVGACACGAVTFVVEGPLRPVLDCHCARCRRFTGHHMAATSAALDDLRLTDDDGRLTWWAPVDGVAYGFCSTCGSSLFWRNDDEPHRWSICAGSLEPPTGLHTERAIWVDTASDYHRIHPDLPTVGGE